MIATSNMSKGLVRKISNLSMFCGGSVPSKEEKGTATRIFVDYKIVLSVTWIFSRVVILWRVFALRSCGRLSLLLWTSVGLHVDVIILTDYSKSDVLSSLYFVFQWKAWRKALTVTTAWELSSALVASAQCTPANAKKMERRCVLCHNSTLVCLFFK